MFFIILIITAEIALDYMSKRSVNKVFNTKENSETGELPSYFTDGFIMVRKPIYNYGAILGLFKNKRKFLYVLIGVLLLFLLVLIIYNQIQGEYLAIPLSVAFGGGCGNFLDRVINGKVTDFLSFKRKKGFVFNLADVFIVAGVILSLSGLFTS